MENRERKIKLALYIFFAAVIFFAINTISSYTLTRYDVDLTEDKAFTLSEGSANIVKSVNEPITLRFFFSNKLTSGIPIAKAYANRIRGVLEQYVSKSDGKITLEVIDPEPFSDDEDKAVSYGIKGMDIDQMGTKVYFGLAATNSVDQTRVIPFFALEREKFLEYEIARIVYDLGTQKKKKIGAISSIQMGSGPLMGIPGLGGSSWLITEQLTQVFNVEDLTDKVTSIPKDIDVLMVVQPRNFSEDTLYAIDQFVMGGGNVVVFADPYSETAGNNAEERKFSDNFDAMLKSWGVSIDKDRFVADRMAARKYDKDKDPNGMPKFDVVDYLAWINLHDDSINRDDVTTATIKNINMNVAGAIEATGDSSIEIKPLIKSSKKSMKMPVSIVVPTPDPNKLLSQFVSDEKEYNLAVRITGKFSSAFPSRVGIPGHIAAANKPGNIILVADTDMLRDETWASTQEFQGYKLVTTTSDNAGFVTNSLDYLSGSSDLIGLRGRGAAKRPFSRVVKLQHDAEEKYLTKEQELKNRLADTERRLGQLQQMAQAQAGSELLYKSEQQLEIKNFTDDMGKIKKELRKVQGELRKGIESLGTVIKFINIWMMPLLVMAFAVFILLIKSSDVRRKYKG
ncbi:MAG: hypothetical protein K0R98_551 [Rickettsiaceae bacterium]|nr:hypothetical protein [Rickettsiaceae bacterium]